MNANFKNRMKQAREQEINLSLTDVISHEDFILALCLFLDEFKRSNRKQHMISQPPTPDRPSGGPKSTAKRENLCVLAATAHKLANDNDLEVPNWVFEPQYKMPTPVFAFNTTNKEYQAFLIADTPPEFAEKNIYHGASAIERV